MSDIWQFVNAIYDVKMAVPIVVGCIAIGYALRGLKAFPNRAIPLTVVIIGALGSVLIQPDAPSGIAHRAWNTKNALLGCGMGFLAWYFHRAFLKKIEDKFGIKGDTNGDTTILPKPTDKP